MGAWFGYGLGTENKNLPGFVVLNGGLIPPGGLDCFGSGFLPATYQGSVFLPSENPIANVKRSEASDSLQRNKLDLIRSLDEKTLAHLQGDPQVEAAIRNYETAYLMQSAVPELTDLRGETEATKKFMVGFHLQKHPDLCQTMPDCPPPGGRGVRLLNLPAQEEMVTAGISTKILSMDNKNCLTIDQPIAGLIKDLKARGMLDETLIVWAGEFGRTPFAQGANGRDHNPFGFTVWMAGGGVKVAQVWENR